MAIEFERKFLVSSDAWREVAVASDYIAQGYLAVTPLASVRVRLTDGAATLTIKSRDLDGIGRIEVETVLNRPDAEQLLANLASGVVEKIRYRLSVTPYQWTVDVFAGPNEGLILLEVEHTNPFELEEPPSWVGAEVTFDPRFQNSYLSEHPFSEWRDSVAAGDTLPDDLEGRKS